MSPIYTWKPLWVQISAITIPPFIYLSSINIGVDGITNADVAAAALFSGALYCLLTAHTYMMRGYTAHRRLKQTEAAANELLQAIIKEIPEDIREEVMDNVTRKGMEIALSKISELLQGQQSTPPPSG